MFEHILKFLHQKDKSVLLNLAYHTGVSADLENYVSSTEDGLRRNMKIDETIYVERNTSTAVKLSILRRLFVLYKADPMDLVFYLKDKENEKPEETDKDEIRKRYWSYAIPFIKEKNANTGMFGKCNPTVSNTMTGSFGVKDFYIYCIANYDFAKVVLHMSKPDSLQNKAVFDMLYGHKEEIEKAFGVPLTWDRADSCKSCGISYRLEDVSITREEDWPRMARFHAEWSKRICEVILPYLK